MKPSLLSSFGQRARETYAQTFRQPLQQQGHNSVHPTSITRASQDDDESETFHDTIQDRFCEVVEEEAEYDDECQFTNDRQTTSRKGDHCMRSNELDTMKNGRILQTRDMNRDVNQRSSVYVQHQDAHRQIREPLSSLQTQLQSYEIKARPKVQQEHTKADKEQDSPYSLPHQHKILRSGRPPAQEASANAYRERHLPSSPSPTQSINAQPSNLLPISVPLHLEFTVPKDYIPVDSGRGAYD